MLRLRKFLRLAPGERRLVIRSALTVAVTRFLLLALPFERVRKALATLGYPQESEMRSRPSAASIAWAVAAAGVCIPGGGNCLVRALAVEAMLARFGHPSELKIGVARTESGKFEAHAWVESEGRVLIGEFAAGRFTPLVGARP
jgi:transglutaminase superfamily protein